MKNVKHERHGMSRTPTYNSWIAMKGRCYNKNRIHYHYYGERGIKVCGEWLNIFGQFLKDMGEKPAGMTLERIDSNGDYCPHNCKWSPMSDQCRNRRNNVFVEHNGLKMTVTDWSNIRGIDPTTALARIRVRGWSGDEALAFVPRRKPIPKAWSSLGVTFGDLEQAKKNGISRKTLMDRLTRAGLSIQEAKTRKVSERNRLATQDVKEAKKNGIHAMALRKRIALGWTMADARTIPLKKYGLVKHASL